MIICLPPLLAGITVFVMGSMLCPLPSDRLSRRLANLDLIKILGYEKARNEAAGAGWQLQPREYALLIGLAVGSGSLIALIVGNPFLIAGGIAAGYFLPSFVILQFKKRKRLLIFLELPDTLKQITARLLDYGSIPRAMEAALPDLSPQMKPCFQQCFDSVRVGLPLAQALGELGVHIRIRKFQDFAETLLLMHTEGINEQSVNTLYRIIDTMNEDLRALKDLQVFSKKEKRDLLAVTGISWFIPVVLSFLNTGNSSLFLDTFPGQIIMLSYFLSTILVIVKGDEYTSLNLDEL